MVHLNIIAFATLFVIYVSVSGESTLYEALSKEKNLTIFYKMVNRDEVLQVLLDRRDVTLFAPTDEALQKASRSGEEYKDESSRFYVLHTVIEKSMFPVSISPYLAGVAPLYLNVKHEKGEAKKYFVNNAKIINEKLHKGSEGKQQRLYIIDEVLEQYTPISSTPPNAAQLLKQPSIYGLKEPLDAFASRVTSEQENVFNRVGNHTFFLPIGSSDSASSVKLQDIDTWVVRSHAISNHVLFLRTMSKKTYKSDTYGENLKVELKISHEPTKEEAGEWYVQSNTIEGDFRHRMGVVRAKIVRPNIPVSNGVVHLISKPLMVIEKTVKEKIEEEKDGRLKIFHRLLSKSKFVSKQVTDTSEKTVFAPTDKAFESAESFSSIYRDRLQKILNDDEEAESLLQLHVVKGLVTAEDVWNKSGDSHVSIDLRRSLYFKVVGEERNKTLTVEAGGVNATAIMGDIGATDGILHIIDRVLGIPYQTIFCKMSGDSDLAPTFKLSKQEDWNKKLDDEDKQFTFFVPNRKAWQDLQIEMPSEHKQLNIGLYSYHVHKILDRHLVVGTQYTKDELKHAKQVQMVHGTFKFEVTSGGLTVEWEGLTANIVRPDVKATNGIIHVIDRVMMKRRDLTKSGTAIWGPSIIAVVFSIILILV